MTDMKTKNIVVGVFIVLIVAALIFAFKSTFDNSSSPAVVKELTETKTTDANVETVTPKVSASETRKPITATETFAPTSTKTPTPFPTPTFAILMGRVNVERLTCRSGPGPYLGVTSLVKGSNVSVTGRDVTSGWFYVRFESETSGLKECWVAAKSINLNGDIASLENYYPGKYEIPFWEEYKPPENIRISRSGDFVNIVWNDPNKLELSERENGRSPQFIIEAWVCKEGVLEFTVLGILDNTNLIITDQPGCAEPSSGLLYSAGRQGYSIPVELNWPVR